MNYEIDVINKRLNQIRKLKSKCEENTIILELKNLGLDIGHGFNSAIWSFKDFEKLKKLTEEIALLLDKEYGLKADLGKY